MNFKVLTERYPNLWQFFKYAVIGVFNTGVDLLVLNIETALSGLKEGIPFAIQKGISFLVAVTFSYFLNKRYTFKDLGKEDQAKKFSQFLVISFGGIIINTVVATVMVTFVKPLVNPVLNIAFLSDQIWVNIGALTGTALGLIWNFLGYKLWVFKK